MISLWLPVAVYMAVVYYGATLPAVPAPVDNWFSDTVLHAVGYTVMALLTLRATAKGRLRGMTGGAMLAAFGISMLHGLSVEWLQMFVPTGATSPATPPAPPPASPPRGRGVS